MANMIKTIKNNNPTARLELFVPGADANHPPVVVGPLATFDLLSVVTEDQLAAMQQQLEGLASRGSITVVATLNFSDIEAAYSNDSVSGVSIAGTPGTGQVVTATSGTTANWQTPNRSPLGTAGGDLSGTYPNPTVVTVSGQYVPDINGTGATGTWDINIGGAANAIGVAQPVVISGVPDVGQILVAGSSVAASWHALTVSAVSGITISGTPSVGDVLTATSSSTADWEAPTEPVSPAGNDGFVQFRYSAMFDGDSNLYWDNVNKRLGLGTSSPAVTLDVVGDIQGSGSVYPAVDQSGSLGKSSRRYANLYVNAAVFNSDRINIASSHTPSSASAAGTTGDIAWDSGFIYICIATNTWIRSAASTW